MATDDLITPERIAREAADQIVTAERQANWVDRFVVVGLTDTVLFKEPASQQEIDRHLAELRRRMAAAFLAAIERFARCVPVPGGLSAERVAEMRDVYVGAAPQHPDVEALLDHVEHLTRALHDCGLDGSADTWAGGYEAGRQAMAEEMLAASREAFSADDFAARFDEIRDRIRRGARQTDGSII